MASKLMVGIFTILISITYVMLVNSTNFDFTYKTILYIPAIILILVFLVYSFEYFEGDFLEEEY